MQFCLYLRSANCWLLQEEKKAKEEKDAIIAAAKKRGAEKAKLTKSLIIMDVKPWDDTTGAAPECTLSSPKGHADMYNFLDRTFLGSDDLLLFLTVASHLQRSKNGYALVGLSRLLLASLACKVVPRQHQ